LAIGNDEHLVSRKEEHLESLLLAYAEGTLTPGEKAEVEAYLARHPQHRAVLDAMGASRVALRRLPKEAAPADLLEDVQAQIERSMLLGHPIDEEVAAYDMRINRWPQIRAAAAVLVLAAGLAAVIYAMLPDPRRRGPNIAINSGPAEEGATLTERDDGSAARTATPEDRGPTARPPGVPGPVARREDRDRVVGGEGGNRLPEATLPAVPSPAVAPAEVVRGSGGTNDAGVGGGVGAPGAVSPGAAPTPAAVAVAQSLPPARLLTAEELTPTLRSQLSANDNASLVVVVDTHDAAVAGKDLLSYCRENGIAVGTPLPILLDPSAAASPADALRGNGGINVTTPGEFNSNTASNAANPANATNAANAANAPSPKTPTNPANGSVADSQQAAQRPQQSQESQRYYPQYQAAPRPNADKNPPAAENPAAGALSRDGTAASGLPAADLSLIDSIAFSNRAALRSAQQVAFDAASGEQYLVARGLTRLQAEALADNIARRGAARRARVFDNGYATANAAELAQKAVPSTGPARSAAPDADPATALLTGRKVAADDVLSVTVPAAGEGGQAAGGNTTLRVRVDADGNIELPGVGKVPVAGLDESQAGDLLSARVADAKQAVGGAVQVRRVTAEPATGGGWGHDAAATQPTEAAKADAAGRVDVLIVIRSDLASPAPAAPATQPTTAPAVTPTATPATLPSDAAAPATPAVR
jgi:hypothetical protein